MRITLPPISRMLSPFRCWVVDGLADRNGGDGGERHPGEQLPTASGHDGQKWQETTTPAQRCTVRAHEVT